MAMLTSAFHLIAAVQFFFGCYYDMAYVQFPGAVVSYGSKFKFLTYLNCMLQTGYFALAFIDDMIGSEEPSTSQKPLLRRIRNTIFCALAFPVAMFVGLTFWSIYAVDRELVLPRRLDAVFPTWLNHLMHTNIMICIFIELASTFRMYPKRKVGVTIMSVFMLCYAVWLNFIYYKTGQWVYPILAVFNWPARVVFYIIGLVLSLALYITGEKLNKNIWSQQIEETIKSGKKKAK